MSLNTLNTGAISFKKLSGKAHTQQGFAVTEEGISSNIQVSYGTVFANPIEPLPVTNSGLTTLYSTNGRIQRIKFQIDIIPNTQIGVNQSQGYRLKLPADWNTHPGALYPEFVAGTYLHTALGKLQIVPALYGTLKIDGSTEYDPILYQTNGSTVITKFDAINWYFDPYNGVLFVQDPPAGFDVSSSRPGFLEAFLYVGDYIDDLLSQVSSGATGTTASNVGSGAGVFKAKVGQDLRFKSLSGANGIVVTGSTNDILISFTGSSGGVENIYVNKKIITGSTTLLVTDFLIFVNGSIALTLTLPLSPNDGEVFKIKDVSSNASTNNITINGNGKNIDGSSTVVINTDRGGIELCFDTTLNAWFIMNFVG